MAGFTTRDDMISEYNAGKLDDWLWSRPALSGSAPLGTWVSFWPPNAAGSPGPGATPATTPGTAYNCDQTSQVSGAMWFPDRSPDQKHLYSIGAMADTASSVAAVTYMLYDRLVAVSGISLATTGAKTVNSTAVPRYATTSATLNEAWLEVTTATATTAPVVNLDSYTSADGSTAQAGGSVTFPIAITPVSTMIQLPLTASKQGVRSVEAGLNVTVAASAGIASLVILRPIARFAIAAGQYGEVNFFDDIMNPARILDNAALALMGIVTTGASSGVQHGKLKVVYG